MKIDIGSRNTTMRHFRIWAHSIVRACLLVGLLTQALATNAMTIQMAFAAQEHAQNPELVVICTPQGAKTVNLADLLDDPQPVAFSCFCPECVLRAQLVPDTGEFDRLSYLPGDTGRIVGWDTSLVFSQFPLNLSAGCARAPPALSV